jgi:pimeloyl-ACP methyl ester carboxylesterase
MSRTLRLARRAVLLSVVAGLLLGAVAQAATTERNVSFSVVNNNATGVLCTSDNGSYTVSGKLFYNGTTPPSSVTLYLHGLGFGAFFWNFTARPGYDYATLAAQSGHASVVIDRLGYGASSRPAGRTDCIGGQATVAHEVVQALRSGAYTAAGGPAPSFGRVALTGHSIGGLIAQTEAATFHDVDALAVVNFSDLAPSPTSLVTFGATTLSCVLGPLTFLGGGGADGYAKFGQSTADFNAIMFHDADPSVVAATDALRTRDPCGDTGSVPGALVNDALTIPGIHVPVLLLLGQDDALFTPPVANFGRLEYLGSGDVTQTILPDTGHALLLGNTAPAARAALTSWLGARGF